MIIIIYLQLKPHFTCTLIVTSHESKACSVYALQVCLHATYVCMMGPTTQTQRTQI